jgi:putative phage-type endonuclease
MKILPFEQGTEEWLLWRLCHITATDAPTVMGLNPWKTPLDLWEEKLLVKPRTEVTKAMQRGTDLEPEAREIACRMLETDFYPAVVEHSERVWQGASLDGLSECGRYILEIKCPNKVTHDYSVNEEGIQIYYQIQIQHQLAVTGAEIAYYMTYRPKHDTPVKIITVKPDFDKIKEMIEMEYKFFVECLCQMRQPSEKKVYYSFPEEDERGDSSFQK